MKTYLAIAALVMALPFSALAQVPAEQEGQGPQAGQMAPPPMSPEQRARFQNDMAQAARFTLPADFMPRMVGAMNAIRGANIQPPDSSQLSLDQTIAQVGNMPGMAPILDAYHFTARDFILGLTAFGMALAVVNPQGQIPPGMPAPNPANVALLRAHPDQVQALMQALGGGGASQQ